MRFHIPGWYTVFTWQLLVWQAVFVASGLATVVVARRPVSFTCVERQERRGPTCKASFSSASPPDMVTPVTPVSEESLLFSHRKATWSERTFETTFQPARLAR